MEDPAKPGAGPLVDDRPLWDALTGLFACPAVLVARDLGLFRLLAERPRTAEEVCEALKIARRPAHAFLTTCAAIGLVRPEDGAWALSPLARDYLLDDSPTSMGGFLDLVANSYTLYSYASVKKAALEDAPSVYGGAEIFKSHEEQAELARSFTRAMHGMSAAPARAWPPLLGTEPRRMLDIGGGSGAHAVAAARHWPQLHAVVLDLPPVCDVAREQISAAGLTQRVSAQPADIWKDPLPPADLHFYSQIFHDWPIQKCRELAGRSHAALEPGGRIVVHEMLLNDDRTGPLAVAAFGVSMILGTQGEQYSGRELASVLEDAGFLDVQVRPTLGYWGIVTGRKA